MAARRKRIYVNQEYFSCLSLENSYYAGWIAADGCLRKEGHKLLIKISAKDRELLENFVGAVSYEGKIRDHLVCGKYPTTEVTICGVLLWHQDLEKHYSIVPKKSLILTPPKELPRENELAFIKGYIDGDGCIDEPIDIIGKKRLRISIVGTKKILEWIRGTLTDEYNLTSKTRVLPHENIYRYAINGKNAIIAAKNLSCLKTPGLHRKWDKVEEY